MQKKIIFIDIDNTICKTNGTDYINVVPIYDRINKINKWFDEGHEIVYWTARGALSEIDYRELTTCQLKSWGCKYNLLRLDKPLYHEFYDDRAFNSDELDPIKIDFTAGNLN